VSSDFRLPILYSFRRCPYAMRARLALMSSGIQVELREILLRDKAPEFLASSPKGTVPILVTQFEVIEESFDVMQWALRQADPEHWLLMPAAGYDWIKRCDGPFKQALDHIKYSVRFPDLDPVQERIHASNFLKDLDNQISGSTWIFGTECTLADMALLPFIRQFANIDRVWFDQQTWPNLQCWLAQFMASDRFTNIMVKQNKWAAGDAAVLFPH
jgi:glutathione S-transferase